MSYDFSTLSPTDFEQLIADLLSREWKTRLESFKEGKDGGIDLLNSRVPTGSPKIIIQCKRYGVDKFSALHSNMVVESKKLAILKPERYVLVTSVRLSKANKDKLIKVLSPYCLSTADVYGGTEVNALIRSHPDIEKAHFKLWIASTAVLDRVLHSKIFSVTEATVAVTLSEVSKLVPHPGLRRALDILNENGHVLIVGNPGIGKTTLARMLLCHFLKDDYEPVWVVGNIDEAWNLVHHAIAGHKKIVVVYDDFLGQAKFSSDRLDKNEDKSLFLLIEKISNAPNIRLILTTREYILEDAKNQHGTLWARSNELRKCTVSVEDYGHGTRAQMLFNHLYFSDLPANKLLKILQTKIYAKLLGHRNFNPRIIETISKNANSRRLSDDDFIEYIEKEFDNPAKLWEHPFNQEISLHARQLLVILWSFGRSVTFSELKNGLDALNSTALPESVEAEFNNSLRQLDGNFIHTDRLPEAWKPEVFKYKIARFQNPSVREFVEGVVVCSPTWLLRIAETLQNIDQISELLDAASGEATDMVPMRFWNVLRMSALRTENEKRKYQLNCSNNKGGSYPAISVGNHFRAHVALVLLKIEERIKVKDEYSQHIFDRVLTSNGWSNILIDMRRSYDAHRVIDNLVDWIVEQRWNERAMNTMKSAFKVALFELISNDIAEDMWNVTTIFYGLTSLDIYLTSKENDVLFAAISSCIDSLVGEENVGVLEEQLDLLKDLEKKINVVFSDERDRLLDAIDNASSRDDNISLYADPKKFTSVDYEELEVNMEDLFKGLMDRDS